MPHYSIRVANNEFQPQDDPSDYANLDNGIEAALGSAVDIVRDLVGKPGESSVTVEASGLEDEQVVVARRIVIMSATLRNDDD
jgi:hypothetical protein